MLYGIDETTTIDIWTHIAFRCATTATVVDVRENVDEKNEEIEIGISIYMNDISLAGGPEEVKEGIKKCARMKVEKRMNTI